MRAHTESKTSPKTAAKDASIDAMFSVGAHYGFVKSRRHPTIKPFIYGTKNRVEIFDLEKTKAQLDAAIEFVQKIAATGRQILFLGSKSEAREIVKKTADSANLPYVAGRWVGGTFTNFEIIRKRVEKLVDLTTQKEKGELNKYTKRERMLIDKEIDRLSSLFSGIISMNSLPAALFVIDSKKEAIAVAEARDRKIPVIALCGSDCDVSIITKPIIANDTSIDSIEYFASKIAKAYLDAKTETKKTS